jgi:hypothetical protein
VGPARVTVSASDGAGQPLSGAALRIEGNMAHAGMVPVFADARETAPGRYDAEMHFTMAGDWYLVVSGRLADGRRLERRFDVRGVRAR